MAKGKELSNIVEATEEQSQALAVLAGKGFTVVKYEPAELAEMIAENMGGELKSSDLQRIRVPSGGGKSWEIIDDNGESQSAKSISGVVLMAATQRAYWAEEFEGGSEPPNCASLDGRTGRGEPGGDCGECPFNEFGSAGYSKACKEMKMLFLLRPGLLLPEVVVLPPSSLGAWRKYAMLLTSRGKAISAVITELGLQEATSKGGIRYAQTTLKAGEMLDEASAAWLQRYAAGMAEVLTAAASTVDRADVDGPK